MTVRPPPIYLDHNATTPIRPEARAALVAALDTGGNPSSVHGVGRGARATVERCRRRVAGVFDVAADRVTFVSGATEGNALALAGAKTVLAGATEHDSVAAWAHETLPVSAAGTIDIDRLAARLATMTDPGAVVVSAMAVNNETGVINPIGEIAALCREAGVRLHCDAAQAVGRLDLAGAVAGADIVTLSGHKFGGPPGIGVVVVPGGPVPAARMRGGGQEGGRRPGTENLPAIAGFHAGFDAALAAFEAGDAERLGVLRDRAVSAIRSAVPEAIVAGEGASGVGNTLCVSMPGVKAETQVMAFDLEGVALSAGSACSSGKVRTSPVLLAMGFDADTAGTFIRVSLGWTTTEADIDRLVDVWRRLHARLGPGENGVVRGAA